jgi:Cu-Zn family superoxide dismutase
MRPVNRYPLAGDNVFPEGITEGAGTTFYVGSLGTGAIYAGDASTGVVEVLLPPGDDGRKRIAGLDIDNYGRLVACDISGAQIFAFDLASRLCVARRAIPAEESWPNDVAVAGDSAYVTDSKNPLIWRLPVGPAEVGEPELLVDLAKFGAVDPAYLNGIVADADGTRLLAASQGEGGTLWLISLPDGAATPVDLGGYEFNADGMLIDGDVLYGVTNRGEDVAETTFMISAARLAPDWRSGRLIGELTDPAWDCPTTIAKVAGQLLIVCSQVRLLEGGGTPALPFEVVGIEFPIWS